MTFNMTFDMDNAAFFDDDGHRADVPETTGILRSVANRIEAGLGWGVIHDTNGNRIGEWRIES